MQDITHQNLETDLVNASLAQPVLLDIWAPWCGPCKTLGPVLEKLEIDYAGRFKLVKLNADEEPEIAQQLSQMFGVRSIPFCVLFKGGQPVDGFVGALPDAEVRKFLDKHVASADEHAADEDVHAAEELLAEGDADTAIDKLQAALATNPANDTARFDYLRALLNVGRVEEARAAFDPVAANPVARPAPGRRRPLDRRPRSGAEGEAARYARRRHRRQQARLRLALRARPVALRRRRVHAGDGRTARDHHARQGLERRARAQELRRASCS